MSNARDNIEEALQRVSDAFFAVDEDWHLTYLNERAAAVLDVDRERVLGEELWEVFEPAVGTTFEKEYRRAMRTQESVSFEEYYASLDAWFEVNAYPSKTGLSVYFRDITERVGREQSLEHYETIFETIQDGVYTVGDDGRFEMVNDAYADLLGYDKADLIGRDASTVVDDETAATAKTIAAELAEGDRSTGTLEGELVRADGSTIEAEATFALLPDGKRVGVVRDISARKDRERELQRTKDLLEQMARVADVGGWEIDPETREVFWTDHLFDLLGTDYDDEPPLEDALDGYYEDDRQKVADAVERSLASGEPFDIEARFEPSDGAIRWLRVKGEPTVEDGEPVSLRGAAVDITEYKEREQQLELYERIVETVEDGVYAIDNSGQFILVNDAFCSLTGYTATELLGEPVTTIKDAAVRDRTNDLVADLVADEREQVSVEFDLEAKSGSEVPVEARIEAFPTDDGVGRCGVVRDITDRKRFETSLVALHRVARELFRATSDDDIVDVTTEAVQDILDTPAVWYFAYDSDRDVLEPVEEAVSVDSLDHDPPAVPIEEQRLLATVFESGDARRVDDLRENTTPTDLAGEGTLRSVICAPIDGRGILVAGSTEPGAFDDRMRQLVEIISTTTATAFDIVTREQLLRRQRDRLLALDDIDSLVHNLAESVFGLSSKEAIRQLVCDRLAESEAFEFAWLSERDDREITSTVEAGVEGYLDDLTLTLDDPVAKQGPTVRAHETSEMQVVRDAYEDSRYEPWTDRADEYGYCASAAIPIADGTEQYGVLNVYSARTNAFDREERDALRRLGSIVAYALGAVERDRQLQRERDRVEFMNRLLRHNLLNSLNVVNARLDLLDGRVDYEATTHLETAVERTQEMVDFVETVREVTKVLGRGNEQEIEPVDIGAVLTTRVERAQRSYPDAEYTLEAAPSVSVLADELLGEALDNVLVNAVQHNDADTPTVRVEARVDEDEVVVSVADNGPGIPDDEKTTVFEREAMNFDEPGSGFGLYLVAEILDSYDGDINITDSDEGGARFELTFQRA